MNSGIRPTTRPCHVLSVIVTFAAGLTAQVEWSPTYGGRTNHVMFHDATRDVTVMFGGTSGSVLHGDTWELSGQATTWAPVPLEGGPEALEGHAIAFDTFRGEGVMFGGLASNDQPSKKTWIWRGGGVSGGGQPPDPPGRWNHAMAYDEARQRSVMFGGFGVGGLRLNDTWEWDGVTWTLKNPVTSPSARSGHAMAYFATTQRVVLFGGRDDTDHKNDLWTWDGNNWSLLHDGSGTDVPRPREECSLVPHDDGTKLILFGGSSAVGFEGDGWEWTDNAWQKKQGPKPDARAGHHAVYVPSLGKALVAGGRDANRVFSDVWEMGSSGSLRIPNQTPPARDTFDIAFDPTRDRVMLVDGPGCPSDTELWEWDGATWFDKTVAHSPLDVVEAGVAIDTDRGKLIVAGGVHRSHSCDESVRQRVWSWNAAQDRWDDEGDLPEGRRAPAMAFDPNRGIMVLFGGVNDANVMQNQTWERLPDASWVTRTPNTIPPFTGAAHLTYDAVRQRSLLLTRGPSVPEHWQWDGNDWTRVRPATPPPLGPMAFDAARRLVVANDGVFLWEWDGVDWTQRIASVTDGAIAYDNVRQKIVAVDEDGSIWYYGPSNAANYAPFGVGCLGSNGIPSLVNASPPWIGDSFSLSFADTPAQPGIVWIGFSTTGWNTLPLPFDLTLIGITGCTLFTGIEMSFPIGGSSWNFTIPNRASLLGGLFYNQALFLDPGTNPFGAVVTNAGKATIGGR